MRFVLPILMLISSKTFASPDFVRDVRPILANHCFQCHGPDAVVRKAKLRLDTADGAKAAIGKAGASDVLDRVQSKDDEQVMPPPHVKKPLSDKQKQVLKDWIAAGGVPRALGLRPAEAARNPKSKSRKS